MTTHAYTMADRIECRAKAIAFHEGGEPEQYRERAEQEAVYDVLYEIDEGPVKTLLEYLLDKVNA